ncbi:MAG: glycosyltransferase family 4 protein [Candidatus Kapaibacterium sp.]
MRTLIVNSMFASAVYRRCADELGTIPGVTLTMLSVQEWQMNGLRMPFEALSANAPYATVLGNAAWRGYENRGFYISGLLRAFQISRPEVLFLMEEPFSIFAAEILFAKSLIAPNIPVVFFTWNNLSLTQFDYRPSFFYRNIARRTLPRMQYGLTANSDGIEVLRSVGFTKPIRTIGYGVDTAAFQSQNSGRSSEIRTALNIGINDLVIGYIGRMLRMKGIDLLVEAFAQLKAQHPNHEMKLLLVGSGEAEQEIMRLAQARGIADFIRHVPSVPQREVPDYMRALDILVLPSRRQAMWAEQFGRVLVEAMAAGKIVIGSSSGAIPEVLGDAGFVFPENDASALAESLSHAIALSSEDRAQLLACAHRRAEYFSWRRFAQDAYEALSYCHANASSSAKKTGVIV